MKRLRRGEAAGYKLADAITEFLHLMYQKKTALRVIAALIDQLTYRWKEFK